MRARASRAPSAIQQPHKEPRNAHEHQRDEAGGVWFLQEPANLVTAYDVSEWLPQFEAHVFDLFWSHVRDLLTQRVTALGADAAWRVTMSAATLAPYSHLSIVPRAVTDEGAKKLAGFAAECLGGDPYRCYFGIYGDRTKADALVPLLTQDQFKANKTWIGWRDFNALGLPDFRRNKDNVLRLTEDNTTKDRVIAQAVAGHLGDVFEKHHEPLRQLNGLAPGV